ncbi:MAG: TRAP transporter substrate-binding protein [Alphaproteobacteria bacterium]|nr:TRAP transporter substrate-binding protein [Alphaproteobacteria bacterium]
MISRRDVIRSGALGAAVLAAPALFSRQAHAVETFKLGHVLAPTHQFHTGMELAARKLAETTDGRLRMEVYPSSQLGTERDMHVAVRTGAVDMLLASPGGASVHVREVAVLDAPYLFRDEEHWRKVVYGDVGRRWEQQAQTQANVLIVGWFPRGKRHVISRTRAYNTIAEIRGQKIRVADLPLYPTVFRAFGAVPTPIAFAEMYSALESGVVDGADAPLDSIPAMRLNEVARFLTLIEWSNAAPGPVLMSAAAWARVPAADRDRFKAAIREGTEMIARVFVEQEEQLKRDLAQRGMTVVTPTDMPAWRQAAAERAIPDLARVWGGDANLYGSIVNVR